MCLKSRGCNGLPANLATSHSGISGPSRVGDRQVNLPGGDHWRVLSNATEVHHLAVSRIPDAIPERFAGCAPLQAASTLLLTNHCYNTPHDESPLQAATSFLMMNQRFAKSKRHSIMSCKKSIHSTRQKSTNHKLEIFRQLFLSITQGSQKYYFDLKGAFLPARVSSWINIPTVRQLSRSAE